MKKLRLFDSLKFVLAAIACVFILNVAHADTPNCASYIDYTSATGTLTQNGTPTPTNPIEPVFYTQGKMVLRAVGDVADSYDATTGKITRRVGVKVLDGTETDWAEVNGTYRITITDKLVNTEVSCNYFDGDVDPRVATVNQPDLTVKGFQTTGYTYFKYSAMATVDDFKAWLADQYAAGTPVIVVYPLATPVTEDWPSRQCETIKIATTRYNEESFAPVKTDLSAAVNAVEYVVSNTMTQAQQIDQIATSKQTRPDESCPPFKKCLLVEDEDGTPHWYEIYDPINDFLNPILAAAGLSGNQGAPVQTTHTSGSDTIYDTFNGFYNGSGAFRQKYIDTSDATYERPFGPTTLARCSVPVGEHTNTDTREAGLCYNTGGMFRTLTEGSDDDAGEWALVWNGAEGGTSLGITPGVVYGIAKCTSVGQHTTEITGDVADGSDYWWPKKLDNYVASNPTTLASLISEYPNSNIETVFNTLPNPVGTDDNPEYPRENFRNCWCKMTAIGVPGAGDTPDQRYANGTIMSVSGGWVFDLASTSATTCAARCASYCATRARTYAAFRRAVLGVE